MADGTRIEWTEATWNPVTGCTKVSPGCDHCYAERITERFRGKGSFAVVARSEEKLHLPLRWRKPRRVFVNSMSDLFHDDVPTGFIAQVFSVMAQTPQHTYQVLTKRHGRMRALLSSDHFQGTVQGLRLDQIGLTQPWARWPLPNVWLGVSIENQQWADIRIPALLDTQAAVRWISAEPLLGPVDARGYLNGIAYPSTAMGRGIGGQMFTSGPGVDWVVVGGESGPGARPMHPDWARSLRDQCAEAGVPFFFKQWGEWQDGSSWAKGGKDHTIVIDGRHEPVTVPHFEGSTPLGRARGRQEPGTRSACLISRVGKKAAGRELDGRTWDEYPTQGRG